MQHKICANSAKRLKMNLIIAELVGCGQFYLCTISYIFLAVLKVQSLPPPPSPKYKTPQQLAEFSANLWGFDFAQLLMVKFAPLYFTQ